MAKPADNQQQPATVDIRMIFPMEVCGIIQRSLAELNAYLGQPANTVDPLQIMARLERMGHWAATLPPLPQPQPPGPQPMQGKSRSN